MSHSMKSLDDDAELKIGRTHVRLSTQSVLNSPLRRSSRIKQAKYSPASSESDTSIVSNNQPSRSTRRRTATMDSVTSETTKGQRTRKLSISLDISETNTDMLEVLGRRTTRSSLAAITLAGTPTKINTRAASKHLLRAGSETRSPLPSVRTTRRTRANSVDPESLSNQTKSQPSTPVKIHKRASVLPSGSPVKEEVEEKDLTPYARLNVTIAETDEVISSDSSPDKILRSQSNKINRSQSISKNDVEGDNNSDKIASLFNLSKSDEICQLSEKNETMDKKENSVEKQCSSEENIPDDGTTIEVAIHDSFSNSSNSSYSKREDKLEIVKKSLPTSPTKKLGIKVENLLNTFVEEQNRSPSNKENQTLNTLSDTLEEKSMQPVVNITPLDIKSLTSVFVNESLNEKETTSMKNESNSDKQRHSRELIETAMKHSTLSKEITSIEEIIYISTDSSSPDVTCNKENLNDSLLNDSDKRQSLVHDMDNKLATNNANESILSQHYNIELVDKIITKDEMSIESVNETNKSTIEVADKSYESVDKSIDKTECKDSNKMEISKGNETSCSPMKTTIEQKSDCEKSSILMIDDNEITLVLEEQDSCQDGSEVLSNVVHSNSDHSIGSPIDKEIPSSLNISCNDQSTVMDKQSAVIQHDTVSNTDFTEQEQENVSKHIVESVPVSSNSVLETNNSVCNTVDVGNIIIQHTQFSDTTEASKNSAMDILSEETDSKNISFEDTTKLNVKQKNTDDIFDNLETEKESLQLGKSQEDKKNTESIDNDSDVNIDINLFKDVPSDKYKEKMDKKENDIETNLEHSQLVEELENESECDLVLVDKQAWLAAKNINAAKQAESFEYDSDDTVLLKSRLDAAQASYNAKKLGTVNEKLLDFDSEEDEAVKPVKARKSLTKRRSLSKKDKDSLTEFTEDNHLITADKSLNKSTVLNRSSDRSVSKLNTSGQIAKTEKRLSRTHDELDEQIEDDANRLNRSLQRSEKNTSLRKSTEGRKSLNKSLKCTSLKQRNNIMQNISVNKSGIDSSEEEVSDTNVHTGKKSQKKRCSLNKSHNKDTDNDTTELEETKKLSSKNDKRNKNASLNSSIDKKSKLVNIETLIHNDNSNDDKSDDSEIVIPTMDFGSKTCSTRAQVGSISHDTIPHFLFGDTDDSTDDSDIIREYNLNGVEQMFSDDNLLADECRASELEFSDSDDNGSDLADFIVNDDELEDEEEKEEKYDDEDKQSMEKDEDDNGSDLADFIVNDDELEDEEEKEEKYDDEDKQSMEKDEDDNGSDFTDFIVNDDELEDEEKKYDEDKQSIKKDEDSEEVEVNESKSEKNDDENEKSANESDEAIGEEVENEDKQLYVDVEEVGTEISERSETGGNEGIQQKVDIVNEKKNKKSVKVEVDVTFNTCDKLSKIYKSKKDKFIKYNSPCTSQIKAKRDVKMKKSNMKGNETTLLDTSNSDLSIKKKKKSHMKKDKDKIKLMKAKLNDGDSKTLKKEKSKFSQSPIVKYNICEDTCQINKKEKKKKQIGVIEQDENVNEDNILERNSHKKEMKLAQHKKKHKKIVDTLKRELSTEDCVIVKKKAKRQEEAESKELLSQKLSKKKKKKQEETSSLQVVASKLKSKKNLELNKSQENTVLDMIKSKTTAFAKARNEALEAIYAAEMCIKNNKELKKKKKRKRVENEDSEQDFKILTKKRKREAVKEIYKSSSSGNLERLPDDVIENLADIPRKAKRQKLSRNEEQIMPSLSKNRLKAKNDGFTALSTSGSTTRFTAVNLRKIKQPSKGSAAAAASFRERMLARNSREPVSAYMMYLEKHAAWNKKFPNVL